MTRQKGRREENREARRATIVRLARDAFLQQGYAATSMSTIAGRLGGSKGTLWAYFPSKEDLFAAVLDDLTVNFRDNLEDALRPGRDCRTTLSDFAERFLHKIVDPHILGMHRLIVGEGGRFPEIGRIFYERGPKQVVERLSNYLRERMEAGDLRADDPQHAARNLIQLTQVAQSLRLWGVMDTPTPEMLQAHAADAVGVFMRAYAA
ncbi:MULTISPECIES: TetR/AcrR family transcriptional regulator [Sphingomonas]|uniref:TetR/AcrR family transcriptional regulator n=1 Tax=Sphingomonas TaxID=13687 RepID=UPI000DD73970|nr:MULTISPECIES: TetR/AcrR family transcriptional regulator [Sphingomonas]